MKIHAALMYKSSSINAGNCWNRRQSLFLQWSGLGIPVSTVGQNISVQTQVKTGRSCKYSSHGQGDVGISGNQSTSCLLICLLLNPTPYRISYGRSLQAPMLSFGGTEIGAPKNGGETANRPCPFHTFTWGPIW